jgi:methionyl-tRNA formyltransferase
VVVAYGLILPKADPRQFPLGCFNLHASLLPRWRGAAPIHRAIMAGDKRDRRDGDEDGGRSRHRPGRDGRARADRPDATTGDLHDKLARLGADLMVARSARWSAAALQLTPQSDAGVTYAARSTRTRRASTGRSRGRGSRSLPRAVAVSRRVVRAARRGRVKILRTTKGDGSGAPGRVLDDKLTVACGSGAVRLVELQRAGGKPMAAEEFLRGTPIAPASVLP